MKLTIEEKNMSLDEKIKESGLKQAEGLNLKLCPKDEGKPMLFAGYGMHDYIICCSTCGFQVHQNNKKSTISRWNVATTKAKSEDI